MSWLPGANPAKVMSSIIRRRNGVIVISLRSKIGRGPPTQPREEILSTVQISDAALTLGEAVSPIVEIWQFDQKPGKMAVQSYLKEVRMPRSTRLSNAILNPNQIR